MTHIEYTFSFINEIDENKRILVVGAGFNMKHYISRLNSRNNIIQNDPSIDLIVWINKFLSSDDYEGFDYVILSRVLEHFPVRQLDWYLLNIYTIMKANSKLICIVPDMVEVSKELTKEFSKNPIDILRTTRLTYELLSEGDHVWDRHATWTCENSMKQYLEWEGLFKVESIDRVHVVSDIVPKELKVTSIRR